MEASWEAEASSGFQRGSPVPVLTPWAKEVESCNNLHANLHLLLTTGRK